MIKLMPMLKRGVKYTAKAVMVAILLNVHFALRELACEMANVFPVMRTFLIVLNALMEMNQNANSVIIRLPI